MNTALKQTIDMDRIPSDLITVAEAAALLRLQPGTVRSWILKRKVDYLKIGGRVFLRRSDLESLIATSIIPAKTSASGANSGRVREEG